MAIDGGTAVIGAYGDADNGSNSGSAYVYTEQPDSTWAFTTKLVAPDGASEDKFGESVAIDGTTTFIGAPGDVFGSAYVFTEQPDGTWAFTTKLVAPDGTISASFGASVAIDGTNAVIGSPVGVRRLRWGSAHAFAQQPDGTWAYTTSLVVPRSTRDDRFGWSVAIERRHRHDRRPTRRRQRNQLWVGLRGRYSDLQCADDHRCRGHRSAPPAPM